MLLPSGWKRVAAGESLWAGLRLVAAYYVIAAVLFVGAAYLFVFVPARNKEFALMVVTVLGSALAGTAFVPHHVSTGKGLVLDPPKQRAIRGAYRRISGTAPGAGVVTVAPLGAPDKEKRLKVESDGRFSTAFRIDTAEQTFVINYYDDAGVAEPADHKRLAVFPVVDRTPPSVVVAPERDGIRWMVVDNSGGAFVDVQLRKRGGALAAAWRAFHAKSHTYVNLVVPPVLVGVFKFCVRAYDWAGNTSAPVCVWSRVAARSRRRAP